MAVCILTDNSEALRQIPKLSAVFSCDITDVVVDLVELNPQRALEIVHMELGAQYSGRPIMLGRKTRLFA
jgi:hypothetical protein